MNIKEFPGRTTALPWYRDRILTTDRLVQPADPDSVGKPGRPAIVLCRQLPDDVFLSPDYVLAVVSTHVWWGKPIDVSWMQMDYQEDRGQEVPIQHHLINTVVMYVDDDAAAIAVADANSLEPVRIQTDCVTDIAIKVFGREWSEASVETGLQVDG